MPSERLLPHNGINLDIADHYLQPNQARYLKNLSYSPIDSSEVSQGKGGAAGLFKPLESNHPLDADFSLPGKPDDNQDIGSYKSETTNQVVFHNYNKNLEHGLYVINGDTKTIDTVYVGSCWNYQLNPENFIHEGGAVLELFNFTDPNTGLPRHRSYYMFTDNYNPQRFICLEDAVATNGFDANLFPYFIGNYDKCDILNFGVPTPLGCLKVSEVPNDDSAKPNFLKFKTWQFRVRYYDVYGRMSEYGIISDIYIPGVNDCIASSDLLARCLDLTFPAGNPFVNIIEIAFRNCNDEAWETDNTLFLYKGSNLGDWWLRERNPKINYNPVTNEITYRFCNDKECNPIAPEISRRTQNPLGKTSVSVAKIGNVIGTGNNKEGFNPFGDIMDNISVKVDLPNAGNSSVRDIEIFVPVYNPFNHVQQPVWVLNNKGVFGGRFQIPIFPIALNNDNRLIANYKQNFGNPEQRGFIGILAGTSNTCISEQYYLDGSNNFVKVESYDNFDFDLSKKKYFQKFTFNSVAPAKYVFRIIGHNTLLTDSNFDKTSTYTAGSFFWANKQVDFNNQTSKAKELVIDVCVNNYSSLNETTVLTIYDPTFPGVGTRVGSGYVHEKKVNGVKEIPVELLKVDGAFPVKCFFTDHNGFYFAADTDPRFEINFDGFCDCAFKRLRSFRVGTTEQLWDFDFVLTDDANVHCGDYANSPCNRIIISGKVTLCNSDIGVPGVSVVLSRGQYAVTGADGTFKIIAHDDCYDFNFERVDKLYYAPTICAFKGCQTDCLIPFDIVITKCTDCTERTIAADLRQVRFEVVRGVLSGGRYGIGIWGGHDWLGRHTFVQTKDEMYVTIPSLVETKTFAPSVITLQINPTATFPPEFRKLTIGITKELSLEDYIEWIVDKVVFIDNSGNENKIAPTQIKIYYASLNEYNAQNNFNTTTGWQFLDTLKTPAANFTSDYVEFYVNGDGQFFPKLVRALVKYDQKGQYFLIDYDSALKDLKSYALIRLCRPAQCNTQNVFFEQCIVIDLVNGKAQQNTIQLNFFDTYYKYRQIPIPVGTDATPQNVTRSFGFPFEHHSPSDFWGNHCCNIGRVNTRNPYEAEIIFKNQIALSGAISVNGQLNFLNFFDDALKKNFKGNFDGIISILPQTGLIGVICQQDVFKTGFNDNLLRVVNGKVQLPSENDLFGEPERKLGLNYGCALFDKNTIRIKEGIIEFLDTQEGALIQYDYSDIVIVSKADPSKGIPGGVDSWVRSKIKYVKEWNRTHENKKYFTSIINPASREYLLTDFTIRGDEFVNENREMDIPSQETLAFDYKLKLFRGFYGFTPEYYAGLEGDARDVNMFAFKNGIPYYHYTTDPNKTYNTFFGVKCEKVFRPIAVLDPMNKKRPLAVTVYCVRSKWFSPSIKTDSGQQSRILLDYFKPGNYFSAAPFLADINTPADPNVPLQTGANKLLDGNLLESSIVDIMLVGDPDNNDKYSELLGITVDVFKIEKSG